MSDPHDSVMESALGRGEQRIRATVVELLEAEGYDAIQVREVARRARVSLAKIYKLYGTRDELILAALDWWMAENCYARMPEYVVRPGESLHTGMMRVLRPVFEPWEDHPGLLAAYFRARASAGGQTLMSHGIDAVFPAAMAVLGDVDMDFIHDLYAILNSLVYGLMGQFSSGEIAVTDIVPAIDRTLYWMTAGYDATR
ncbi:TetR family transcriptional regulator [Nocardia wallacei]|uniref:TetR family transcriptional regulator n=1 Tax=Nocardia wallacei TaxID=480035 RepID=UPI002456BE59|nr:TetR family transcriptional regulator [Nocardia wallacei]